MCNALCRYSVIISLYEIVCSIQLYISCCLWLLLGRHHFIIVLFVEYIDVHVKLSVSNANVGKYVGYELFQCVVSFSRVLLNIWARTAISCSYWPPLTLRLLAVMMRKFVLSAGQLRGPIRYWGSFVGVGRRNLKFGLLI